MIQSIYFVMADRMEPYHNMGLEELLLHEVQPGECILYLWQNQNTVVIGRNQNGYQECRVDELEAAGGRLARRLSGGGAVFHDVGNLNFTFLVRKADYDLDRQTQVILEAVQALGVHAERTGRNDLTVDGRKFSGNAYYTTGDHCYHHGTIMVEANTMDMSRYLTVSEEKLRSKGVKSVGARVINLSQVTGGITIQRVEGALVNAFGQVYGLPPQDFSSHRVNTELLNRYADKFASWEWRLGSDPPATCTRSRRFPWGEVEVALSVAGGIIRHAAVYTDALDPELSPMVVMALTGAEYSREGVNQALMGLFGASGQTTSNIRDIAVLLEELWE